MAGQNPVIRGTNVLIEAGRRFGNENEAGLPVESNDPRLRYILIDLIANRPSATSYGKGEFWASDEKVLYLSDGATWYKIGVVEYEDLTGFPKIEQSVLAGRPAASAGNAGRLWFTTNLNGGQLSINSVAGTWVDVAPGMLHSTNHESTGSDPILGDMDANARVGVRKNSAGSTFKRRRINLIEGANITLTVADDSVDEEVDVTIAATGGGGGAHEATHLDGGADEILGALDPSAYPLQAGTLAARPATPPFPQLYYATDNKTVYRYSGGWSIISTEAESGLHGSRPAASANIVGKFWLSTNLDGGTLFLCTSAPAWVQVAAAVTHGGYHADGGIDEITTPLDPRAYPITVGTLAARPGAGAFGMGLYYGTDTKVLYRSDGAVWSNLVSQILSGLHVSRPAATADYVGSFWFSTNLNGGTLFYCNSSPAWVQVSPGLVHGVNHMDGGSDEISTATPGVSQIPKSNTSGVLDDGWLGELKQTSNVLQANFTILDKKSVYVTGPFEIKSPAVLTLAGAQSRLEIG